MPTKSQWNSIPNVEEQTELENGPIKIRWSGRDRARVRRGLVAALEDGYTERGIAVPVMMRQESQIVIKTQEELDAFTGEFHAKVRSTRVRNRIPKEIQKQLDGYDKDDDGGLSLSAQKRKRETDLDILMEEIVIPHAREKVNEVWPGGTVDVDNIDWFWNPQLSNSAGMAYHGTAVPERYSDAQHAIALAPEYYYKHGTEELLKVVRHELIHQWQYMHPDSPNGGGHGRGFKQWVDDMNTNRYCNHW